MSNYFTNLSQSKINQNSKNLESNSINNKEIKVNNNLIFNFGTSIAPQTDLVGHILVSLPTNYDSLISNPLMYIASHSNESGAFGFILNSKIGSTSWGDVLKDDNTIFKSSNVDIYCGGIEQQNKGFVLHSQDYNENLLFSSTASEINVSCNNDIIKSIVYENRPSQYLFVTGCTTWKKHQLEREIMNNMWMILNPSFAKYFIFNKSKDNIWSLAMNAIGINAARYVSRVATD